MKRTVAEAKQFACPECLAQPGEPCQSMPGGLYVVKSKPLKKVHDRRRSMSIPEQIDRVYELLRSVEKRLDKLK